MKKMLLALTGLVLLAGCTDYKGPVDPVDVRGSVCLINGRGDTPGTISVINGLGIISNDVTGVGMCPNHIMEHGGSLYVVNSGNNNIQIIDAGTLSSTGSIELTAYSNPMRSAISNRKLYATNMFGTGIDVYDFDKDSLYTLVLNGIPQENGTDAVISTGSRIYAGVKNYSVNYETWEVTYHDEYIAVIDAEADTLITSFKAGINIAGMLINHENELHVLSKGNSNDIEGFVRVFDLAAADYDSYSQIELGSQPGAFGINSEGMVYVAVSGFNPDWTGFGGIMKYNSVSNEILYGADNMLYSSAASGILGICIDGYDKIYASLFDKNELVIIENDEVKSVLTTGDGPQGMVFVKE